MGAHDGAIRSGAVSTWLVRNAGRGQVHDPVSLGGERRDEPRGGVIGGDGRKDKKYGLHTGESRLQAAGVGQSRGNARILTPVRVSWVTTCRPTRPVAPVISTTRSAAIRRDFPFERGE